MLLEMNCTHKENGSLLHMFNISRWLKSEANTWGICSKSLMKYNDCTYLKKRTRQYLNKYILLVVVLIKMFKRSRHLKRTLKHKNLAF